MIDNTYRYKNRNYIRVNPSYDFSYLDDAELMMMAVKKKKKKSRHNRSVQRNIEKDVLQRAMTADCGMLMSSASFGSLVTVLTQMMTLLVLLLLSIVLSLLHEDSTAISYVTLITLIITILIYELGITRWNVAYSGTFRLVILWNLWVIASVLFKLYDEIEVFGRVMAVLVSVFSTSAAVISLCVPSTTRIFSFLTILLLLFPLSGVGLFGENTLLLSVRIVIYIFLCIILDRMCPEAKDSNLQLQRDVLLSACCFWVLLVLPQFWFVTLLLIVIGWYKARHRRKLVELDNDVDMEMNRIKKKSKEKHSSKRQKERPPSPSPPHQTVIDMNAAYVAPPPASSSMNHQHHHSYPDGDIGGDDIDLSAFFTSYS